MQFFWTFYFRRTAENVLLTHFTIFRGTVYEPGLITLLRTSTGTETPISLFTAFRRFTFPFKRDERLSVRPKKISLAGITEFVDWLINWSIPQTYHSQRGQRVPEMPGLTPSVPVCLEWHHLSYEFPPKIILQVKAWYIDITFSQITKWAGIRCTFTHLEAQDFIDRLLLFHSTAGSFWCLRTIITVKVILQHVFSKIS